MYLDLDLVKKHLNLELDFIDDDDYILALIDVAEDAVQRHLNEGLGVIIEKNEGKLPPPISHACLLFIGNLYQNREIISSRAFELPFNYHYLLSLYRKYD